MEFPECNLLQAIRVGRRAGNHWLLQDVSLRLQGGDRIALVGPSGSGKSLLLRSLALLDPLDEGVIRWRDHGIARQQIPEYRSRIIYLQQQPALLEATVLANLKLPFELKIHRSKSFQLPRILESLNSLGRDQDFLQKHQSQLSGGEAQLTALLRTVQLDPDVLLLDEPTAALDAASTEQVETLVNHWLSESPAQRAIVWVTHDATQAQRISTSIQPIRDGQLQ